MSIPRLAETEEELWEAATDRLETFQRCRLVRLGKLLFRVNRDPAAGGCLAKFEIVQNHTFRPATETEIRELQKFMALDMCWVVIRSNWRSDYGGSSRDHKILHQPRGMSFKTFEEFCATGFNEDVRAPFFESAPIKINKINKKNNRQN